MNNTSLWCRVALCLTGITLIVLCSTVRSDEGHHAAAGVVTTLLSQEGRSVKLMISGHSETETIPVPDDSLFTSKCRHCDVMIHFKAKDAAQKCPVCPCEKSNLDCTIQTSIKPASWQTLVRSLPKGTAIHVVFLDAEKPETGAKSLSVDFNTVLIPVEHMASYSVVQLMDLVKPFGVKTASLEAGGSQLLIALKAPWTVEKEAKLEKVIVAASGRISWPDSAPTR